MATKKATKRKNPTVPVGDFVLEFSPKYERAVNELKAEGNVEPSELEVLTRYDKLGGRITYEGQTVRLGSFWDFDLKQPKKKPTPVVVRKKQVVEEEVEMDVPMDVEEPKKTTKKS